MCCNHLSVRGLCAVYCVAVTLAGCQQALRVSSPVHVMAEVRGIMSAQGAYCSLSLILTHSLARLFTICDALEQCQRSRERLCTKHCNVGDTIDSDRVNHDR